MPGGFVGWTGPESSGSGKKNKKKKIVLGSFSSHLIWNINDLH